MNLPDLSHWVLHRSNMRWRNSNLSWGVGRERTRGRKLCRARTLTQGLEDAGSGPGCADGLEVQRQGQVIAQDG